ncbi:MAG: hypothetical protein ABSC77_10305 [Terracidiphilus sp.]|jgi:hypothetical protein
MAILNLASIKDTVLWKKLDGNFSGPDGEIARTIAGNLVNICEEAADRMRTFPSLHRQYTIHDDRHFLRVTELMSMVIPQDVLDRVLNPIEITLLILSAFFHDQGMVLESNELTDLSGSGEFRIFRESWEVDHPNVKELRAQLASKIISDSERQRLRSVEQELDAALLTDFVRRTHGRRSAQFLSSRYGSDARLEVCRVNLVDFVARLAETHVASAHDLIQKSKFRFDEAVGQYRINMVYLALVLRIADILDFDRDRTPDSLYRTIDFTSRISLHEWEKHRSVEGWSIRSDLIQFTMSCIHPEYQRAAYTFMDWVDEELGNAAQIARQSPAEFSKYRWDLPLRSDRSRIGPRDGAYIYQDLEFSLSRDEVVRLLMMDELYEGPWLCVRELLQNGLDALRYRRALYKREDEVDWNQGKVSFQHYENEDGIEILRCSDNGIGMDLNIIRKFLTNVGRSYYRSPEFESERAKFRASGVDFDPCSQFGIGFMSCFMIGDRIRILTRRDNREYGKGDPLEVAINGLSGMVVVRPGLVTQPIGTIVEIMVRKQAHPRHKWLDRVRLVPVLKGYALACEFLVEGECSIQGIADKANIKPQTAIKETMLEKARLRQIVTLSQDFSEINPLLSGKIRASFLADSAGKLCLSDGQYKWAIEKSQYRVEHKLLTKSGSIEFSGPHNQTCMDGILVAGELGGDDDERYLGMHASPVESFGSSFVIDIRGCIKPALTPSRFPPRDAFFPEQTGRWAYISSLCGFAEGRIWEEVAKRCATEGSDPCLFWQLAMIYSAPLLSMRGSVIWKYVAFPISLVSGDFMWVTLENVGGLSIDRGNGQRDTQFVRKDGSRIAVPPELVNLERNEKNAWWSVQRLLHSMCALTEDAGILQFLPLAPADSDNPPSTYQLQSLGQHALAVPYRGGLEGFFSANGPVSTVNRDHPLARLALDARFREERTELEKFATNMFYRLSEPSIVRAIQEPTKFASLAYQYSGALFDAVDWQSIDPSYAPPFKIRDLDGNEVILTEDVLRSWTGAG